MASKNKVTLTFAGDEKDLVRSFDRVRDSAQDIVKEIDDMESKFSKAGDGFDKIGEGFGTLDTRAMGYRDTVTGIQDGWAALGDDSKTLQERMLLAGNSVGDLASGMENLIVPLTKVGVTQLKTSALMVKGWVMTQAAAIKSIAIQVAGWIKLGVQSLISAAKVALAWLISMGPIILVIAAVIGLVVIIIKNWDTIKEVIAAGWEFVKRVTTAVWDFIKNALTTAVNAIKAMFADEIALISAIITVAWDVIKTATTAAWDFIHTTVQRLMTAVKTEISDRIELIKTIFSTAWTVITTGVTTAWTFIFDKVTEFMNKTRDKIKEKIDDAIDIIKGITGRIRSALSGAARAIVAPFKSGFDGIKSAWNNTVGGKGFTVPSWVPSIGGKEFRIPKLAQGGIVRASRGGSLVNVGEGGQDEAVIPLDRMGEFGGSTVVRLESSGSDVDDFLIEMLRRAIKVRGGGAVEVLG